MQCLPVAKGTTAGGMLMTLVASHAIARGGWRVGYEVLAAPMALVAAPLIWLLVRTRPTGDVGVSVAAAACTRHASSRASNRCTLAGLRVANATTSAV
jgi:hypothetical protein